MDLSIYSERLKALLQSAQTLALRRSHQQLTSEHFLATLLEDAQGVIFDLLNRLNVEPASLINETSAWLEKLPKVEGKGAGQIYMEPGAARVLDKAEQLSK